MTPAQFDLIAMLLKSREPIRTAARMVLLDHVSNADAARSVDAAPQSVHRTVRRFNEVHAAIEKLYGKGLQSTFER